MVRLDLPPGALERAITGLQRGDVLLRIGVCVAAAAMMWLVTGAGARPFPFRLGDTPDRDIVARVAFSTPDPIKTQQQRDLARTQTRTVYKHTAEPITALRDELKNKAAILAQMKMVTPDKLELWAEFATAAKTEAPRRRPPEPDDDFELFQAALAAEGALDEFKSVIDQALAPLERQGLLEQLPGEHAGNQRELRVYQAGQPSRDTSLLAISDVLMAEVVPKLKQTLATKIPDRVVAEHTFAWLAKRLKPTLEIDRAATAVAREEAAAAVPEQSVPYPEGAALAHSGKPFSRTSIDLLRAEHDSPAAVPTPTERFNRTLAIAGMFAALFTLCGYYIYFRERQLLTNLFKFLTLLTMVTATVLCAWTVSGDRRAEMIPMLLFGMIVAVAYHQEIALLLSAAVALVITFLLGYGLPVFVVLVVSTASAISLLGRIRSRSKLIYVGLVSGGAAFCTAIGVHILDLQPLSWPPVTFTDWQPRFEPLFSMASWCAMWVVLAAFLMTGLLPFVESLFGVQTDLSLIELGDVSHPLLQELVRRAPGTYNHSINVASLGEAAAEAIGAHGLLVRVGAYFHDIGKMLKPGYYVENQGTHGNRHEDLVPAMSTLVIIAHVKDGADLARQHHLPRPIIDFIEQHHGTTLVEYFYGRAAEMRDANPDPDSIVVDEANFRYPGPKPQTKEAAVLMLADAAESACRSLVEPAPARIEGLIQDLAMKRLLDGQFDACGLTLQELHTVQESLVKSLIAVYHGRVKYPDQRTA